MEQVNLKEIQRTILLVFRHKNTLSYLEKGLSKEKILKIILNKGNIGNDPESKNYFLLIFPKLLKKGLIKREFGANQYYRKFGLKPRRFTAARMSICEASTHPKIV